MISGSATQVSVFHELLDVNRFRGSDYERSLNAHFRVKYRDKQIGVIIAVGPAALEYVLRSRAGTASRDRAAGNKSLPGAGAIALGIAAAVITIVLSTRKQY